MPEIFVEYQLAGKIEQIETKVRQVQRLENATNQNIKCQCIR